MGWQGGGTVSYTQLCDDLLRTIKVTKSGSREDLLIAAREAKEEFGVDVIGLGLSLIHI